MSKSPKLKPHHQLYADLMDESRIRLHAMRDAIDQRDIWAPRLLQEFCYLQLRMLCEGIALGCLIAHGEITNQRTLRQWKIPEVMKRLNELAPDFFPRPIRIKRTNTGIVFDDYKEPHLSKSELVKLWERSGSRLHRGPALKMLDENGKQLVVELDPILLAGQKIKNLLEQHIMSTPDGKQVLIIVLSDAGHGGNASLAIAE